MIAKRIAFIGAGNITRFMLSGLLNGGYTADSIVVTNRSQEKLKLLVEEYKVRAITTNSEAVESSDIVILAVKPQIVKDVCRETAEVIRNKKPLIISLATATRLDDIASWLGDKNLQIIRTMSNLTMSVGMGTTAMYANSNATPENKLLAENIFNATGNSFWVSQESDINTLSPLIGCSPAYLFLLVEAMQQAAIDRGVPEHIAEKVALDSILGAAQLAKKSEFKVSELRKKVTTPNGVTEAALKPILLGNYFNLFTTAFKEAIMRCNEIEETVHLQGDNEHKNTTTEHKM